MISTCTNLNPWTLSEQLKVKTDYLNGKPIDCIAKEIRRHENTVCIELISQGLMHETSPENVSLRHTYFEYGQFHDVSETEEIESEYDPYDLTVHVNLLEYLFFNVKNGFLRFLSYFTF